MNSFKALIKPPLRMFLKFRAKNSVVHLCSEPDAMLNRIGEALKETLQNDISSEEKIWIDELENVRTELISSTIELPFVDYGALKNRTVGEVCLSDSKQYFWYLFLFKIVRKFNPLLCLELGTSLGISSSFIAAALCLNGNGKIITLEGEKSKASLAEKNFRKLNLKNVKVVVGYFQETLGSVLAKNNSIDYAFIDGHHEEKATIDYFEQILPYLSKTALLIFDDIAWSKGMRKAWEKIINDKRIKISVYLRNMGVCVIDEEIKYKKNYSIPLI